MLTALGHGMVFLLFLNKDAARALLTVSTSCSKDIVRHHANKKLGFKDPEWAEGVRDGRPYTKFLWNGTWVTLPCHVRHMKIEKTRSPFAGKSVYTLELYSDPYPHFTREEVEEWAEDRKCPYQEWLVDHVQWTGSCDRNEWKRFKLAYKEDAAARDRRCTREAHQREEAARRAAEEEKARLHAKAHPFIPLKKPSTPAPWAKKLPASGAGGAGSSRPPMSWAKVASASASASASSAKK